jgi:UDP-glucose 4-epimerase
LDGKVLYYLAGEISVQESMQQPQFYWERNVVEMARILYGQNPRWIYFSSSAAVYQPIRGRLKETDLLGPVSVYGMTKLVSEQYLQNCYPKKSTIFRFFNASGGQENHDPETHFIPRMIQSSFLGKQLEIYGDGEQVRDFVHVDDIADAHKLAEGIPGIFNLGSGVGYPINEVVRRYKALTGKPLRIVYRKERKGDPKHLVADITRAETVLGWRPKYTLDNILWSAYKAYEDMNAWRKDETFSSCG